MMNLLFPLPTNGNTSTNFVKGISKPSDANEYLLRLDHRFGERNQLFARYGQGNVNYAASSALLNTGSCGGNGSEDAVMGDTFTLTPTPNESSGAVCADD
jgi:hypothetical protein